ncbi:MAG: acyloxyacyl hydrolase [Selenomonas ruminantium]|jgi:hypothetical protein|nr:acyloxyacyl hydrolase [Selenomonas ruminantium]
MRTGIILAGALLAASWGTGAAQAAAVDAATLPAASAPAAPAASREYQLTDKASPAIPAAHLPENTARPQDTPKASPAAAASTAEAPAPDSRPPKAAIQPKNEIEVQFDYLHHCYFDKRYIDNYNLHIYKKWKRIHALSIYGGVTITGANGYLIEDSQPDVHKNSDAFGIGPSVLLRFEKRITGKLYADLDASGSLRIYGKAHPAGGRAFDFLWRIGPRLTYRCTDDMAISLGYMFAHMSNGFSDHNPGYNAVGFSLGFQYRF